MPKETVEAPSKIADIQPYPALDSLRWYGLKYDSMTYSCDVKKAISKIIINIDAYKEVELKTGIPAVMVAAIHYREASLDFNTCLHNGDPLPGPTVHVPENRGPFKSWSEAAIDAMTLDGFAHKPQGHWTLEQVLKSVVAYNGQGYTKRGLPSPYCWAMTSVCDKKGYFTGDGHFDPNANPNQYEGAAIIIKELELKGLKLPRIV